MRLISFFILLSITITSSAQGLLDGYMKGKSNTDIALSGSFETGSKFFLEDGTTAISRSIASVNLFAAHGITNWLDGVASLPFVSNGGKESGLQDASLFLRAQLLETTIKSVKTRFMLGVGYQFPVTDYETENSFAIGQQGESKEIRGIIQFEKGSYFLMLKGGYSFRNNPNTNALPLVAKIGIAKEKFYADLFVDYLEADGGGNYLPLSERTSFQELGVSYLRIGGNLYRPFSDLIGGVAGVAYTLDGRNIGQTIRLSVGLVVKL